MEVAVGAPQHLQQPHHKVELIISYLLRIGVFTSLAIVVAGMVLSFTHHPEYVSVPGALQRVTGESADFPHTVRDVVKGCLEFSGRAIIMAGLLLLIATPVLRVAVSIIVFIYMKDRVFIALTTLVLTLLLLSFVLGKTH